MFTKSKTFCYEYVPEQSMQTIYNSCSCEEQEIIKTQGYTGDYSTEIKGGITYSMEYREVYLSNLTSKNYLINTMLFKEFVSLDDVSENSDNAWVISSSNASLPKLYWEN